MTLTCGGTCMKYILFIFNFIFVLASILILALSIWLYNDPTVGGNIEPTTSASMKANLIFLMVLGSAMLLISFLGCCGACRESTCMLATYAGLLILIIIAQIVVLILVFVYKRQLGDNFKKAITEQVREDVKDVYKNADEVSAYWHQTQITFKCCGASGYTDYKMNRAFGKRNPVPLSCCKLTNDDATKPEPDDITACYVDAQSNTTKSSSYLYVKGCYEAISNELSSRSNFILIAAAVIAFIEIFGVIFACCVRSEAKNTSYE